MGRPTSVLVFAIINIVWVVLGVCGLGFELAMRLGLFKLPTENNPALQLRESNPGYRLFTDVMQVLGAVGVIVLLASAVGLLLMKPWARVVTIAYGVYAILTSILGGIVNFALVFGPMLEQTGGSGPERVGATIGVAFAVAVIALVVVYWLLVIFFLTRRGVVTAFKDQLAATDDGVEAGADLPWDE